MIFVSSLSRHVQLSYSVKNNSKGNDIIRPRKEHLPYFLPGSEFASRHPADKEKSQGHRKRNYVLEPFRVVRMILDLLIVNHPLKPDSLESEESMPIQYGEKFTEHYHLVAPHHQIAFDRPQPIWVGIVTIREKLKGEREEFCLTSFLDSSLRLRF